MAHEIDEAEKFINPEIGETREEVDELLREFDLDD